MTRVGIVASLIACIPAVAQGQTAMAAMDAAAERYRSVRSLCSDFEQVMDVRLLRRTIESEGRLCQQRPNLFSMRFTDPAGDLVVSDGGSFWVYYPSLNPEQVVRYDLSDRPGTYDFFQEFLNDPASKYAAADGGAEEVGGKDCQIVELTPTGKAAYRSARVWLDPETDLICQLEVHQDNGTVRTITLRGVRLNPTVDVGEFAFVVPDGARVVEPPS